MEGLKRSSFDLIYSLNYCILYSVSWGSSVSIVMSNLLHDEGFVSWHGQAFLLPPLCTMGTTHLLSRGHHFLIPHEVLESSAKIKSMKIYIPYPYVFVVGCIIRDKNNITFNYFKKTLLLRVLTEMWFEPSPSVHIVKT